MHGAIRNGQEDLIAGEGLSCLSYDLHRIEMVPYLSYWVVQSEYMMFLMG